MIESCIDDAVCLDRNVLPNIPAVVFKFCCTEKIQTQDS
jgi:hypothetical protein